MLEKALQVIQTNLTEFENKDHSLSNLNENIEVIAEKLIELNENNNSAILESKISSILPNINTLSEQIRTSEDIIFKDTKSLMKDIKDDIELVIVGMNNINHYVNGVINDNDRLDEKMEIRLNAIEKKSNITNWIIISLLIITILELFLFFGY